MSHSAARRGRAGAPGRRSVTALAALAALDRPWPRCSGPSVGAAGGSDEASAEAVDWSQVEPAKEITWWSNHPGASQEVEQQFIDELQGRDRHQRQAGHRGRRLRRGRPALPGRLADGRPARPGHRLGRLVVPLPPERPDHAGRRRHGVPGRRRRGLPARAVLRLRVRRQHWAVPYARSTPLFYYNKDLWAAAGLPDRGPETWAELEEWDASLKQEVPEKGSTFGLSTGPRGAAGGSRT